MNHPLLRKGVTIALFALLCSLTIYGQQITGSISGVVMDSSRAAIPAASVTMTNESSGDVRRSETNTEGFFNISSVFPGSYTVRIEAPGFNTYEARNIQFTAGDRRTLGQVVLDVATAAEEVTVSAVVSELTPVESGEKAVVLTTKQFENVSVVGRSAAEYLKILPGIAPVGGLENRPGFNGENIGINGNGDGGKQSMLGNVSANGTREDALDITADGSHVSDPGCNCATPVNPNPEMISEFKVQQSNFSAEYAKGPVVVNSITKSGGQDFHGSTYLYARHHTLNSNDALFNKNGQEKPKNKYFFPGGNIGGPVLLPGTNFNRNRDKMFFFAGYEYFRQTIDTGLLRSVVPTQAMRNGDFSDTAYMSNLLSNTNGGISGTYAGGIIPQSEIDPGMAALLNNVPLDNRDPATSQGFNWIDALVVDQNMHQFSTRIDYSFSDFTKLFIRYNLQREVQNFPIQLWWRNAGAVPMPTPILGRNASDSISMNFTKVLSPTLTNETVFGYTFVDFPNQYEDDSIMMKDTQGYPYQGIDGFRGDPKIPGMLTWAAPAAGMWLPGGMDPVLFATKHLVTLTNNTTKVTGTHTLKFGGYWGFIVNKQPGNNPSAGLIQTSPWHGLSTGNMLADMVSGRISNWDQDGLAVVRDMGWSEWAGFVQDAWKVKPNLTLEFGARFQHLQPWTARNEFGIATWVESHYDANRNAPAGDLPGVQWHSINPDVSKAGWDRKAIHFAPRVGFAWDMFSSGKTVFRGGFGVFHYHDDQLSAGAMDLPAGLRAVRIGGGMMLSDVDNIQNDGTLSFGGETVDSADNRMPSTYSWNLTVSQRLSRSILWETSYVGNQSWGLTYRGGLRDINQVPVGAMINDPEADANNFRPRPQYNALNMDRHQAYTKYNALQTTLTKQTGMVNFTFAYTWSKAMGIVDRPLNSLDRDANYGPLAFDRTHILAGSYVLNVPDLVDAGGNGFAKGVANGWQISGIVQWNSGVLLQQTEDGMRNFNMTATVNGENINSAAVTGTDAIQLMPIVTCDPREGLGDGQYINGACFGTPIPGQNGQLGANGSLIMPYLSGPAFFNWDMSLFKNFKVGESKNFQFRASFFNWMNHPVRSFIGGDSNLRLDLQNNNGTTELINQRFGFADNTVGKRIISLGIKFQF